MSPTSENAQKLLLHACCGPCSLEPIRLLREAGWDPSIFYANSNIHPADEYQHRLATLQEWAYSQGIPVIEGSCDPALWEETAGAIWEHELQAQRDNQRGPITSNATDSAIVNHGVDPNDPRSLRCRACYRLRFEEAARYAKEQGFAALGTTLSVSPYQFTDIIKEELERAAHLAGIVAVFQDYRPYYDAATERSRNLGMYRQNYCGCRFSNEEAERERQERKAQRLAAKEAKRAAEAAKRAEEAAERAAKKQEKAAYAEKQRKKRAVLKELRKQQEAQTTEQSGE